jgi:hypothetical protein
VSRSISRSRAAFSAFILAFSVISACANREFCAASSAILSFSAYRHATGHTLSATSHQDHLA